MFKAANPYDDIVTKATAETLTSEDWQTNLDICDKVSSEGETGARNCITAIQKRLVHRNANVQLYSLTLSDALAKNSGLPAHRELASRNFTQTLARVVADRNTHQSVRTRAVTVLKEWANDFDDGGDGSLGLVKETVEQLRQQGFTAEADRPKREEAPTEPSSEQLRKEDEELRRVLELSMQDQGGRGAAYGGASSAPGETAAAATSSSSSRPPGSATAALLDKSLPNPNAGEQASASRPQQQQQQASPAPPAAAATPAPSRPSRVRALYDFSPTEAGELPFSKGDVIRVLDSVYEHWWRGELRGEVGIFPVNYVEVLPDPTPEEIRREAEQEARIFQQAGDIDRLLAKLRQLEAAPGGANLAEDEELQDLYQSSLAMRPRIVRLIDRYSGKVQELRALNDKFVRARGTFDAMMERSMAVHQPGQNASAYLGVRPEYGYAGQQPQGQPQYHQQQPQQAHGQGSQDSYHSQQAWQQQQQPQQPQAQPQGPPQQQNAPPQDPQAYAQWYHQQQQQQQQQQQPPQQHQQAPQQHQQQGGYPSQYPQQHEAAPQHQQHQQQHQPQAEEEKQRLYEQARREAEAYHAAYGNHNAYQGASGSTNGAAMAAAPGGGM